MTNRDGALFKFLVLAMNAVQHLKRPMLASLFAFVAMTLLLKM
jgi:hypothetical protein